MSERLYIGSNGHVCAIEPGTGTEIWRTRLLEGTFRSTTSQDVSILLRGDVLYAGCNGNLFGISAKSGEILWHNELKGLRYNDISLAMEGVSVQFIQKTVHRNTNSGSN